MTDQTGVNPPAAGVDDLDTMLAQEQNVPVNVVRAIRQELQTAKTQNLNLQDQVNQMSDALTLYRNQLALMNQGQGGSGEGNKARINDVLADKEDDEVLTVGEARALVQSFETNLHSRQVMKDLTSKSDFQEVINHNLPNVLRLDPELGQIIAVLPEPLRYALGYRLGQLDPDYKGKKVQDQISAEATRIMDNLNKPGSPSGKSTAAPMGMSDRISQIPVGSPEWRQFREKLRSGR